jgi:hypothetical protein
MTNIIPVSAQPEYVDFSHGHRAELLYERQIVVIRSTADISFAATDAWINMIKTMMYNWPIARPYVVLYDLSDKGTRLTSYMRKRLPELWRYRRELRSVVAYYMTKSLISEIARPFIFMQRRDGMKMGIFYNRDEALAWLVRHAEMASHTRGLDLPPKYLVTDQGAIENPQAVISPPVIVQASDQAESKGNKS